GTDPLTPGTAFDAKLVYNSYMPRRIQSKCLLAALSPGRIMVNRVLIPVAVLSSALAGSAVAQSVIPDSAPATPPAKPALFNRIIANEKKGENALGVYDRIERVET